MILNSDQKFKLRCVLILRVLVVFPCVASCDLNSVSLCSECTSYTLHALCHTMPVDSCLKHLTSYKIDGMSRLKCYVSKVFCSYASNDLIVEDRLFYFPTVTHQHVSTKVAYLCIVF